MRPNNAIYTSQKNPVFKVEPVASMVTSCTYMHVSRNKKYAKHIQSRSTCRQLPGRLTNHKARNIATFSSGKRIGWTGM